MQDRIHNVNVLYVNVYPVKLTARNDVLFLLFKRREDIVLPGVWQPVSGKLKAGEKISRAFLRQVAQKTDLAEFECYASDRVQIYYDLYYDAVMAVPRALAILDRDPVQLNSELHTEFRWVTLAEFEHLVPFTDQHEFARAICRWLSARDTTFKRVES